MKVKDVPQDNQPIGHGETKDTFYAVDDNGNFIKVLSKGWHVTATATDNLQKMFHELEEEAKEKIKRNETSPLEYFMHHFQMDLPLFAAQMGISQRRIKKHFKPDVFKKLDDKTLQGYADFFQIDINELKNFGS
jgi:hypothetical protein